MEQRPFDIKGVTIGSKRPVICVPVVEHTAESVIRKIRELVSKGVQMIEWRVDYFEEANDPGALMDILENAGDIVSDTPFLFTFRSEDQGGNMSLKEPEIIRMIEIAAKSGYVDMIDLEFFGLSKPEKEIARLQRFGVKVIASHHDFRCTPDDEILKILLDQLAKSGADVAKLAVMPLDGNDVLRLLNVTYEIKKRYHNLPIVTISMGPMGVLSRICGEVTGSCITFGSDGAGSAPGQMRAETLSDILDALHESMS